MQTDSIATMLPKVVLPYLGQWAERSGLTVLSKLLVDDQFLALIARYGDQFIPYPTSQRDGPHSNGNPSSNGYRSQRTQRKTPSDAASHGDNGSADAEHADLADLQARVLAMEAKLEEQQTLFEVLRSKIRPLALALGCCPECMVGLEQCPRCFGESKVAHFEPDPELLRALIANPLIARGVPLTPDDPPEARSSRRSQNHPVTKKRSKP
jgi:hypothetical protein